MFGEIIKSLIAAPLLFIIDLITGDFKQMKEDLDLIWNTLVQSVMNIWASVKNIFTEYIGAIVNSAIALWTGFIQSISNIWNEVTYQATMIWIDLKLFLLIYGLILNIRQLNVDRIEIRYNSNLD